jgi:outer membrane receptor protein involved in Fe transport
LKDRASVGLAYSKRIERTTTFKMNPFPEREHSETLEQGDPNLQPEMIDQVELKFQFKTKKRNLYNTALYLRNIDNLINRVNTVYNDTILNRIYSNVGKAKVLGREVSAEYSFGKRLKILFSSNSSYFFIKGSFDNIEVDKKGYVSNYNLNSTYRFSDRSFAQFNFNYLSRRLTAQGEDSQFYSPNLTLSNRFWNDQLTATLQWKNIDMGLMNTNEQRITTQREGAFYTTTNYVYEVDVILLSLSYNFNNRKNTAKFVDSEFGKKEF